MMSWAQSTLEDEKIFPVRVGEPFPRNIHQILRTIFKRLFRVYAHMYVIHFAALQEMGAEPHLNTCFRHFMLFVREFDLVEAQELAPLKELIDKIYARDDTQVQQSPTMSRSVQCADCAAPSSLPPVALSA